MRGVGCRVKVYDYDVDMNHMSQGAPVGQPNRYACILLYFFTLIYDVIVIS